MPLQPGTCTEHIGKGCQVLCVNVIIGLHPVQVKHALTPLAADTLLLAV